MNTDYIKKLVELADGFEISDALAGKDSYDYSQFHVKYKTSYSHIDTLKTWNMYPLLLRRAVEGWNRKHGRESEYINTVECYADVTMAFVDYEINKVYRHKEYEKTDYLTCEEQAIEACLIELLEAE